MKRPLQPRSIMLSTPLQTVHQAYNECASSLNFEELWLQVPIAFDPQFPGKRKSGSPQSDSHFTEASHETAKLDESSDTFQDSHMREANFL